MVSHQRINLMMAIAEQVDNLKLLSRKLYEQDTIRDREYRRLQTFNRIIVKANESTSQKELLQGILDACIDFVHCDLGGIYLIRKGKAHVVVTKFIPQNIISELDNVCMDRPDLKDLFTFAKPQYIHDYDVKYPKNSQLLGGIKTLIAVPILYNDSVRGCINVGSFNNFEVTDEECEILRTLGKHLGHVLHRFEVEQELELRNFEVEAYNQELRASLDQYQEIIHKLESSQQQLDLERQNFKFLFNKIEDMIFVISLDGIIMAINDAVRNRLGYPNGSLIGMPVTMVHETKDGESVRKVINGMVAGNVTECTLNLISKSGEVIPVDTRVVKGLWDGQECLFGTSRELIRK